MNLQFAPSSSSTAALGGTLSQQRTGAEQAAGGAGVFGDALYAALDSVSISLREAKAALDARPQAQQGADLAEVFKGFSVLRDQLAQAYGVKADSTATANGAGGDGAAASAITSAAQRAFAPMAASPSTAFAGAAPVTWENYSSSATYQEAKSAYVGRMEKSNPTEQWVIAALNKAIEQSVANGHDPEKSHSVNTLRGYFSGDAQLRSNAIHSIDRTMLAAGGAYETFDYGLHTIAGAVPEGMNTTMPTFKTAYDKDWSRPSLYDQINSSLG